MTIWVKGQVWVQKSIQLIAENQLFQLFLQVKKANVSKQMWKEGKKGKDK